tara:strand:- start:6185 stop:6346 length:162 start_codon:yes stop_codon:yes gene_type:complete
MELFSLLADNAHTVLTTVFLEHQTVIDVPRSIWEIDRSGESTLLRENFSEIAC